MRAAIAGILLAATLTAAPATLKVQITTGTSRGASPRVIEVPLERYVAGVLAGESRGFRSDEALKAMAVVARTYAIRMQGRHRAEGFDLCDTTHCQRLDLAAVTPRLEKAVHDTEGEMVWYQGKLAFTPYTRDCGGKTEDAEAVWPDMAEPYLRSHPDPWCARGPDSHWEWNADALEVLAALRSSGLQAPGNLAGVSIVTRTPSGRASMLLFSGPDASARVSASTFRFAIGRDLGWNTLRSDAYAVLSGGGHFTFVGAGSGHGVGLCQRGAGEMGGAGRSYRDILAFYFPGTTLGLDAQGLDWQRLTGETISLMTVRPSEDGVALVVAEKAARTISARTGWPVPSGVEIRVYPDLETFRNSTAEPGWVAAHSQGSRIDLQPVRVLQSRGVLESTIAHELVHVTMESQAAAGLPVWFREGVVDLVLREPVTGTPRIPSDDELRQTGDPARARRAYRDAAAMVASLGRTYGETVVLGWIRRGLPPEVTNASASHPVPNSR